MYENKHVFITRTDYKLYISKANNCEPKEYIILEEQPEEEQIQYKQLQEQEKQKQQELLKRQQEQRAQRLKIHRDNHNSTKKYK